MSDPLAPPPPSGEPVFPREPLPSDKAVQVEATQSGFAQATDLQDMPAQHAVANGTSAENFATTPTPDAPPPAGAPIIDAPSSASTPVFEAAPVVGTTVQGAAPPPLGAPVIDAPPPAGAPLFDAALPPNAAEFQVAPTPEGIPVATTTPLPYDPGASYPAPAPLPALQKKRSKKPLIIVLVAAVAIIAIVAGVLAFQEVSRSTAYDEATTAFNAGSYYEARDGFAALGDYRDAADWYERCLEYLTLESAVTFYNSGDYDLARTNFEEVRAAGIADIDEWMAKIDLAEGIALFEEGNLENALSLLSAAQTAGIPEAEEWVNKTKYAQAEEVLASGDVESAYYGFKALGSYSDSADRAAACTQPFPATGIIYQDGSSYYDYCAIDINYNYTEGASFYKIYNGETLVASVFMNASSSVRIHLRPGNYTIKEGSGEVWFGPELAFGTQGWYSTMTFDETGTDFFTLSDGDLVTLTINTTDTGNVSERDEDLSSF